MRSPDWWPKLQSVALAYSHEPWEWGRTDCAHFMADCVQAVTGVDPLGTLRNNYRSRLSCAARIRAKGFKGVEDMAASVFASLNWPECPPRCTRPGDVGVTSDGVLCVRFPIGFVARSETGTMATVEPVRAWAVAWGSR